MKLAIDQTVLVRALEKGAMAALSDEAQGDTSSFAPLIQSVKITVGDDFIVESGTSLVATKWSMKSEKENGIDVKEGGTILVPAKLLYDWASKQTKSKIVLNLAKLDTPEVIKSSDGDMDYSEDDSLSVKKIGNLKLASRDDSKTGNRWHVDCYDHSQLKSVDFKQAPDSVITIPSEQMTKALKNVAFASQPKDYQHVLDSVAIESFGGSVCLAATDAHRCSIYKLDQATDVNKEFFVETTVKDGNMSHGQKILIPSSFLKSISKLSEGADIEVSYDAKKDKVYLKVGKWYVRLTTVGASKFNGFPTIALLMSKKYEDLASVPKSTLMNRLVSASLVNDHVVLFNFSQSDKGDMLVVHAVSERGYAPNVSNAPVEDLKKSLKAVWGVKHITEVSKVIEDDSIFFTIPDDMRSVRIVSKADPNLQYYSMAVDNPIYYKLLKD